VRLPDAEVNDVSGLGVGGCLQSSRADSHGSGPVAGINYVMAVGGADPLNASCTDDQPYVKHDADVQPLPSLVRQKIMVEPQETLPVRRSRLLLGVR
jgi:hypothetical protein